MIPTSSNSITFIWFWTMKKYCERICRESYSSLSFCLCCSFFFFFIKIFIQYFHFVTHFIPAGIYLLKVNNKNTRTTPLVNFLNWFYNFRATILKLSTWNLEMVFVRTSVMIDNLSFLNWCKWKLRSSHQRCSIK